MSVNLLPFACTTWANEQRREPSATMGAVTYSKFHIDKVHFKELKKQVRGVRGIERSVAFNDDPVSETVKVLDIASVLVGSNHQKMRTVAVDLRSH